MGSGNDVIPLAHWIWKIISTPPSPPPYPSSTWLEKFEGQRGKERDREGEESMNVQAIQDIGNRWENPVSKE